jgi:hypothetical protein
MNARALKKVVPSEDEIRRVVVGLSFSPTQKGLSPATSYQEVVNFFVKSGRNEADVVEKVNSILMTKTKLIKTKLGSTVVDWIY